EVVWEGRKLVNFSSNDYLGLAQHPKLKAAALEATARWGSGAGAARLICGTLPIHRELEQTIAAFKGVAAALSFGSGYAAAVGTICALVGSDDIIILDKLVHASLVDGARLSGAKLRVFHHNDVEDLEKILKWAREKNGEQARVLVVTESVFSMDGDRAPLREIVELKDRYGAWLMLDEAHALGVLGKGRRGLAEELGVADRIDAQMGTLGKAVGSCGGFIAGSTTLVDHLINSARSFIFSTAPGPASVAAAKAGIDLISSDEGEQLRTRLIENVRAFTKADAPASAIVPVILCEEDRALAAANKLKDVGFLVPAIRYPTVARGKARLRVTLSAAHTQQQIDSLLAALSAL
ncbi:MAG TPA: aminotransferase class I/II-fold pyridoxal phosphate-dependent enzyme, partial [Verrucomicrobiae bacterium]|nr:aminotransferase class I/II-fold pyridoxal phosphate-dependent enzyme [Verrucomicrobiae bacterium]